MDVNISSNGGNSSAINMYSPPLRKMKGFGNFADSNNKAVPIQSKRTVQRKRSQSKARPLKGKQNLG